MDDRINEWSFAFTVLVGCAARWIEAEPFYPDPSFTEYLRRVWGPWGWPARKVYAAIELANIVIPEDGDPATNRAIVFHCFELVTGGTWRGWE